MNDDELAVAAALAGADAVRRRYGGPLQRHMKSAADFATEADLESEAAVRAVVAAERPDDAFLGEEGGLVGDAGSRRRWYVDPLCGTLNFAAHTPLVGVNVALAVDGVVTAAAVADPFEPRVFTTTDDLRPTALTQLVDVDFDRDRAWAAGVLTAPAFERFGIRVVSSSLAAVWVAAGRRAGYVFGGQVRGSVHFAAPVAVCRAAGCVVTDLRGGDPLAPEGRGLLVAADAATHEALLAAVGHAGPL